MTNTDKDPAVVCAVGDVVVNRVDPKSLFEHVAPVLTSADAVWGNCESAYAQSGTPSMFLGPVAATILRGDPRNVEGLTWAGFNVMGLANNRILENGYEAFFETIDLLHHGGIATTGGGKDIYEARKPAIVECRGTRVAFLAYAPVTWPTFEATLGRPGVASLKIHTFYEVPPVDVPHHGKPPYVHTIVDPTHLESFQNDVRSARREADVVIVGFHWGIHFESGDEGFSPLLLADYEFELGHAAVDAGADVVLGGGQHVLKAVEAYEGKVIFHGLGIFGHDLPHGRSVVGDAIRTWDSIGPFGTSFGRGHGSAASVASIAGKAAGAIGEARSAFRPDPDDRDQYPTFPFHPLCRRTMVAKVALADGVVRKVSIVPCLINKEGQPEPFSAGSEAFEMLYAYIQEVTVDVNLDTKFSVEDGEMVVSC
jgi:poly-gamma-glutamate synthesis protein (capsule biosynthesis protein)